MILERPADRETGEEDDREKQHAAAPAEGPPAASFTVLAGALAGEGGCRTARARHSGAVVACALRVARERGVLDDGRITDAGARAR